MIPYYEIKGKLAHGSFGTVWKISMDNDEYAMKTVKQNDDFVNREEEITKKMDHPNIVKLHNSWVENSTLHLIMECVPMSLREYIKTASFSNEDLKVVSKCIFAGLEYLASMRVCHRDIKPDNLLFDPGTVTVKICDFGCSKVLQDGQPNVSYVCSRYYRAPELLLGATTYSTAVDMWSAGCVIAELTMKKILFEGCDSVNHQLAEIIKVIGVPSTHDCLVMNVKKVRYNQSVLPRKLVDVLYEYAQFELIDLLSKILVYNPVRRLSPTTALNHAYFSDMGLLNSYLEMMRNDFENNDLNKIEERFREMYNTLQSKHNAELEIQEKVHAAQYKSFMDSPVDKGGKKWSSPVAGVFSRIKK